MKTKSNNDLSSILKMLNYLKQFDLDIEPKKDGMIYCLDVKCSDDGVYWHFQIRSDKTVYVLEFSEDEAMKKKLYSWHTFYNYMMPSEEQQAKDKEMYGEVKE